MAEEYVGILDLLDPTNATLAADIDNKIVVVKTACKNSFPNVTGAVTKTHTAINALPDVGDVETVTANWVFSGAPQFSGAAAFTGTPVFSTRPFKGMLSARFDEDAAVITQSKTAGLSATRTGTGDYEVTHNLNTLNYAVFITAERESGIMRLASYVANLNTVTVEIADNGGANVNAPFSIIIVPH